MGVLSYRVQASTFSGLMQPLYCHVKPRLGRVKHHLHHCATSNLIHATPTHLPPDACLWYYLFIMCAFFSLCVLLKVR
ncbi:hypothetical protein BDR06DRAFT_319961 [Suillus hirtellus]|nr:hypothetical protein BDR06DRAFT_319961 [Suillus hirtellus]